MSRKRPNSIIAGLMIALCAMGGVLNAAEGTAPKKVSVKSLNAQAKTILNSSLIDKSPKIRTHAIEVAVKTRQKDALPVIAKLTKDPSVPSRFAAVTALGDLKSTEHEELIRKSLNDSNVNVRIAAAYSLVKLGQSKYEGPLLAAAKSADQTVRANAALLIGKLGKKKHLPLLHEVLNMEDSETKVRMQAVESIARLGDEEMYRSKLWALQISKFADDRVMGIRGMGALNTAESRAAIATMLQDDIVEVRLAAAEQLAQLGDDSGEREVYSYFQTNPDMNKADIATGMAILAIGNLKSKRLNAYLPAALGSRDPYIRLVGAQSVLLQTK